MRRSRRCPQILREAAIVPLAFAAATMFACSERPTEPSRASSEVASALGASGKNSGAVSTMAWQARARGLVTSHGVTPINAVRIYALHSVAQYAAVVAVSDDKDVGGGRASYEAQRGAIAGASAEMLTFLFPDAAAALEAQVVADGNEGPGNTHPHFTRGVAAGRAAAASMKNWARTDGFSLAWNESMRNASGVGVWEGAPAVPPAARPAPAGYQFPTITPYFLQAANGRTAQAQFRPAPPPAYSLVPGSRFQTDLAEVKNIAVHRTQTQIDIANYWNLSVFTPTALGHWDEQAAEYIDENQLDERDASHLYALMNAAVMDATIGCWDAKYFYLMLRPTMADRTITTVYPLPNHPSYPSGHSCVSAAAVTVLERYFPAHTAKLETDLAEAGMSRIYGGIHYRFDIEAGQTLGRQAADRALAYDQQRGLLAAVGLDR